MECTSNFSCTYCMCCFNCNLFGILVTYELNTNSVMVGSSGLNFYNILMISKTTYCYKLQIILGEKSNFI